MIVGHSTANLVIFNLTKWRLKAFSHTHREISQKARSQREHRRKRREKGEGSLVRDLRQECSAQKGLELSTNITSFEG